MEDQVKKMVLALLAYAVQRDISAETLCRLSRITLREIRDEERPLTDKQVQDIWINAIHISKDKLFGLHFGESLQLSALGIVGELIKSSDTVGNALTVAASLTHLITTSFKLDILRGQNTFTIRFIPLQEDWKTNAVALQILDLLMVFVIHELDGLMLRKIAPISARLNYNSQHHTEYQRVLRCPPTADWSENSLTFNNSYWNEPIITANYEMYKILLAGIPLQPLYSSEEQMLQNRILNYLMNNSYLGIVSLEDIASNFNTTSRTLQRKLKAEGINFQQLSDQARKTLALRYLKEGAYPVKQVSHMLGYNELSAFTRTFKRWTGFTPSVYHKNSN